MNCSINNNFKNFNSNKKYPTYNDSRKSDESNNYFMDKNKCKKKEEKNFILKDNMFPQLNNIKNSNNNSNSNEVSNNFSSLFKSEMEKDKDLDLDLDLEKDRWITIKKGEPYKPKEKKEKEENQVVEPYKVFEKLNQLYEQWKKNYIEQWGYDEYEKYYRFPNYDYSYLESEEEEIETMDYYL